MAAAAKPQVSHGRCAASCVSKLVVELEARAFAAAHPAVIDISAAPFVALPHRTAHRTGYMPATPARGIGAASVVTGLGRQLGGVIAIDSKVSSRSSASGMSCGGWLLLAKKLRRFGAL